MNYSKSIDEALNRFKKGGKRPFYNYILEVLGVFNDEEANKILNDENIVKAAIIDKLELSKKLYKNSVIVADSVLNLLNQHIKTNKTIKEISRLLYEGYNFRDKEVLQVKKDLPLYLKKALKDKKYLLEAERQIKKLKSKDLQASYYQVLEKKSEKAVKKAMSVAMEEKSRYYADRIAITESYRARNLTRARELLADNNVEFVKFTMSSKHNRIDICDYYARLNVGFGAGVVKKKDMMRLPLHPHCKCKYEIVHNIKKSNIDKNPLDKFSEYQKAEILGGRGNLEKFYQGENIENIFNSMRSEKYKLGKYESE